LAEFWFLAVERPQIGLKYVLKVLDGSRSIQEAQLATLARLYL